MSNPAPYTVAAFNARRTELVTAAGEEARIDAEICRDRVSLDGTEQSRELAIELVSELLGESDTYSEIRDPELRAVYRAAYSAAFLVFVS